MPTPAGVNAKAVWMVLKMGFSAIVFQAFWIVLMKLPTVSESHSKPDPK